VDPLDVILDPDEPAADVLAAVARGARPPVLRLIVPPPAVSFGRLDALRPGYDRARAMAVRHGFTPLLRAPGGHAAAYHEGCLIIEEIVHERDAMPGVQDRFADRGERLAGALRGLGVDARVGEVPGEYCAGRFSVNARSAVKLVGTAQRVVRDGWLFGAVITVTGAERLRAVLTDVYAELEIALDPRTVGGVADEAPGVTVEDVRTAVVASWTGTGRPT
jgi:octanoyl-[GcvH]:protein N-octanoyltransferase